MRMLSRRWEKLRVLANQEARVKRKNIWITNAALTALIVIVCGGSAKYWRDQRAEAHNRIASIEALRCEQRVESREALRGVLLGIAVALDADDETVDLVSTLINDQYPPLDPTSCANAGEQA